MIPGKITYPLAAPPSESIRSAGRWLAPLALLLALLTAASASCGDDSLSGRQIMDQVFERHELFPHTFEEQTMVLMDSAGHRDARKLRRFSRIESDGTLKYLLVFDHPSEVRGVALLAIRHPGGRVDNHIYLPAFGPQLKSGSGDARGTHLLGTDFALEDLTAELVSEFRYQRREDREIEKVRYFVVDAYPGNQEIERTSGYGRKRHFVRQDTFVLTRTDYFDNKENLIKRQTRHDLRPVDGNMWRADMILMENRREQHRTLIKIDQRVFSQDNVPAELFTPERLVAGVHEERPRLLAPLSPDAGEATPLTETPDSNGATP